MGRFQTPRQQRVQGQTYVHINIYSKNDDQLIIRASALSAPSLNQYHIDSRSYVLLLALPTPFNVSCVVIPVMENK